MALKYKRSSRFFGSFSSVVAASLVLASCGGGSSGSGAPAPVPTSTPTPTPSPSTSAACSLRARQDWAFAQLNEWYVFPSLFDAAANPASYGSVDAYIDALVAPARAQNRDRHFTYLTSIAEEDAYYASGSTAGFGIRLGYDGVGRRVFVIESFEGAPALAANIDRGDEIIAIGTPGSAMQSVTALMTLGGSSAVVNALGPDDVNVARTLRIRSLSGAERDVTLTKADYALDPVSNRYGAKVLVDGSTRIGYINLRSFIDTAEPDLRAAFADFKAQGVTQLIVDLRYNGGGLISTAEAFGNLMAGGLDGQVYGYITYRDSKAANNESFRFAQQVESIQPTKIAFIGTGGTASASELLINGFVPYFHGNMALVGTNTYGKPVGQIALDRPECDDRLRALALKIENADHQGEYFTGLASVVPVTCRATDDLTHPIGDPAENMIATALDYLAGRSCSPISLTATASASLGVTGTAATRHILMQDGGSTIKREVPGSF
ncbi:MAG: hypothetical protein RLZZ08_618 [Pseudomonadota bacterium]|jgi:C-terminal processing protease CtpA/Prc